MKLLAVAFGVAIAAFASAQLTPFEFGAAYAQSGSFTKSVGGKGRIEGIELSISQSFLKLPFVGEARLGVSALLGGGLNGGDSDGNVYRIFARYKTPSAGPTGFYGLIGINVARAEGRAGSFTHVNGSGIDLGVGTPLGAMFPGMPSASLEFINHQSSDPQLRGWSLGLTMRF